MFPRGAARNCLDTAQRNFPAAAAPDCRPPRLQEFFGLRNGHRFVGSLLPGTASFLQHRTWKALRSGGFLGQDQGSFSLAGILFIQRGSSDQCPAVGHMILLVVEPVTLEAEHVWLGIGVDKVFLETRIARKITGPIGGIVGDG